MGEPAYKDQAMRPSGALGRIMGEIMAATNRPRNRWLIEQLDMGPGLSGLEFGFGNGETLMGFLNQSQGSRATGIDWSQSMIDVATHRNVKALAAGRLHLQLGDITDPDTPISGVFDRIWCSNVIQMIEDRPALFRRLRTLVTADGLLALCFQPRGDAPPAKVLAPLCCVDLSNAGFSHIETRWMPKSTPASFCIVARP
jgi:cyclopropane fatty-acyl-phospholipid synthase-like methyltransferase